MKESRVWQRYSAWRTCPFVHGVSKSRKLPAMGWPWKDLAGNQTCNGYQCNDIPLETQRSPKSDLLADVCSMNGASEARVFCEFANSDVGVCCRRYGEYCGTE